MKKCYFLFFNEMITHNNSLNVVLVVLQLKGGGTDAAFVFGHVALKQDKRER